VATKPDDTKPPPEAQLRSFIERFDPKDQTLFRSIRAAFRKRFPTANELAYDYGSSIVLSYSPTDRGIDAVVAIAVRADGVRLYLNQATRLPDPKKLLLGSGKQARFIRVEAPSRWEDPDVQALIAAAVDQATVPLPSEGRGKLILRSEGAKKRPTERPTK
jgi:hypothetical protein